MVCGVPPFQSDQAIKTYEKITAGKYREPSYLSEDIKDFIRHLIQADLTKRYGILKNGVDDIKQHKWLEKIDWIALYKKEVRPPFKPIVKSSGDSSNFDEYKEEELPKSKECLYEKEFADF